MVIHSLAKLRTLPWFREAIAAGTLELSGFRFEIRTGVLLRLVGDDFVAVT